MSRIGCESSPASTPRKSGARLYVGSKMDTRHCIRAGSSIHTRRPDNREGGAASAAPPTRAPPPIVRLPRTPHTGHPTSFSEAARGKAPSREYCGIESLFFLPFIPFGAYSVPVGGRRRLPTNPSVFRPRGGPSLRCPPLLSPTISADRSTIPPPRLPRPRCCNNGSPSPSTTGHAQTAQRNGVLNRQNRIARKRMPAPYSSCPEEDVLALPRLCKMYRGPEPIPHSHNAEWAKSSE